MAQAFMWGPTVKLSNAQIAQLAAYYAAQTSVQGGSADPTLVQAGEALFVHGMANSGVAPCITCHGPDAQGKEAIPSLAGQHAEYLVKQLGLFKTELRTSADAALMHASVAGMTFEQMVEVAAYLSSR